MGGGKLKPTSENKLERRQTESVKRKLEMQTVPIFPKRKQKVSKENGKCKLFLYSSKEKRKCQKKTGNANCSYIPQKKTESVKRKLEMQTVPIFLKRKQKVSKENWKCKLFQYFPK